MTSPVTVSDADRRWWADYLAEVYGLTHPDVVAIQNGERDGCQAVQMIGRHRIASAQQARLAALDEAAEVAKNRHEKWRMPHPDDAKPGEVCDDISACRDIADAILHLKETPDAK